MKIDSIQFITDKYSILTKNQRVIADYIIANLKEAISLSVGELASRCGVSAATPVRLARRLGFDGFASFRLYLAENSPADSKAIDIERIDIDEEDSVARVLNAEIKSIKLTLEQIDTKTLTRVCELIHSAKRVLLVGAGTSYLVAKDLSYKLIRIGRIVLCADNEEHAAVILSSFERGDIVLTITHSGEGRLACRILKLARELGVCACAMTAFAGSTAYGTADIVIKTQTRESPMHKLAFSSRTSQLAAADALFMTYYSLYLEECRESLSRAVENKNKLI